MTYIIGITIRPDKNGIQLLLQIFQVMLCYLSQIITYRHCNHFTQHESSGKVQTWCR